MDKDCKIFINYKIMEQIKKYLFYYIQSRLPFLIFINKQHLINYKN